MVCTYENTQSRNSQVHKFSLFKATVKRLT